MFYVLLLMGFAVLFIIAIMLFFFVLGRVLGGIEPKEEEVKEDSSTSGVLGEDKLRKRKTIKEESNKREEKAFPTKTDQHILTRKQALGQKEDIDRFIRMTSFEEESSGNIYVSYDNCPETLRGVYTNPIYIEDKGIIYVYGVMKNKNGEGDKVFVVLNNEEITLDFPGRKQFINATFYYYNSERDQYDFAYNRFDCPTPKSDLINPFVVIEQNCFATDTYPLFIVKNSTNIIKVEKTKGERWGKLVFSKDANILCDRNHDNENGTVIYDNYDISGGEIAKKIYHMCFNQQLYGPLGETDNYYHFYFAHDNSKASAIIYEYATKNCDVSVVPNEFDDDETEVLDLAVNKDDYESIGFLHSKCPNTGRMVYGIDPIKAMHVAMNTCDYNDYLHRQITDDEEITYKAVFELFEKEYRLTPIQAAKYIYEHYAPYIHNITAFDKICSEHKVDYVNKGSDWKEKYNDIYNNLVETDRTPIQWKSEANLYRLIKKNYDDAIYQYHDRVLLGMQSFDVYVPSLKLAFEYQGRQHYEPIEHFGGEKAFIDNQIRDARKRQICKDNDITLIEWKYDEPISLITLKHKLKQVELPSQ